jgi:hypothetical protein
MSSKEVEALAAGHGRSTDVYKGFRVLPARTPGRFRIVDERGNPVVPLSLRIYSTHEAAIQAIRVHASAVRAADEFRGPETKSFAGRPPADTEPVPAPVSSRRGRLPQIEMKANLG